MKERKVEYSLYIAELIYKYRNNTLSESESDELNTWIAKSNANRQLFSELLDDEALFGELLEMEGEETDSRVQSILKKVEDMAGPARKEGVVRKLRRKSWYWAAAALLVAFSGTIYFINRKTVAVEGVPVVARAPIEPGGDKAILKLADGTLIPLDSSAGDVINLHNVNIRRENGMVVYSSADDREKNVVPSINTIQTPKGGQYQVVLPDGTRVWLNAASSITFPTVFTGKERHVEITGEAYFEVAAMYSAEKINKEKKKVPFLVRINTPGGSAGEVVVLGTHFNINAYGDEPVVRTTLVEGSIVMRKGKTVLKMQPGQQLSAAVNDNTFKTSYPNMQEVLAWKNGRFIFNNSSAVEIMRQISRWYDVKIEFEGDLSSVYFSGGISRKDDVSKLLAILESEGRLEFTVKGKTISVRQKSQ